MDDKKKKYIIPEAEVVDFNDDIITLSALNANNVNWIDDDNTEDWA